MVEHLAEAVRPLADRSIQERIDLVRKDIWINYPVAVEKIRELEDLLTMPRQQRAINKLLFGRSNNGKSAILKRFCQAHPPTIDEDGRSTVPVVYVSMPSLPIETDFWSAILKALKIAHRDTEPAPRKRQRALDVLERVQTRVLVVDEIHNLLQGRITAQKQFLVVLKNLTIEARIPIVAAGTDDALHTFATDEQFDSRFQPMKIPDWKNELPFHQLLAGWERLLPLRSPSNLPALASRLHYLADGTIGGLALALKAAAVLAIRNGKEQITAETLELVQPSRLSQAIKGMR